MRRAGDVYDIYFPGVGYGIERKRERRLLLKFFFQLDLVLE